MSEPPPASAARLFARALLPGRALLGIMTVVAIAWFALALYRHLTLGSSLFDLGIFDQIVWNTAEGRPFACSIHRRHFLADHFGPAIALLAPLYWIVASPIVLLAVDVLCVVLAVLPLHAAARSRGLMPGEARWLCVVFLAYPSATSIAVYDFHPDMLALPWLMAALFFESQRCLRAAFACALAALACKEEYAVWCAAFGVFITYHHRSSTRARWAGLAFAAFALVYLLVVMRVVIPSFDPNGFVQLSRYAYLGQGPLDVLHTLVTHPAVFLREVTTVKLVHLFLTFALLGFLPLRAPRYLAISLPTWGYNLLSTHENQSFLHYQNVVPILPPLFFATLEAIAGRAATGQQQLPAVQARRPLVRLLTIVPVNVALALAVQWWMWIRHDRPDAGDVRRATASLPAMASLSTTNALGSHFSERQGLIKFPLLVPLSTTEPVDYVLVPLGPEGWRYSASGPAQMAAHVRETEERGYAPVAVSGDVVLLGRGAPPDAALAARVDALLASLEAPRSR